MPSNIRGCLVTAVFLLSILLVSDFAFSQPVPKPNWQRAFGGYGPYDRATRFIRSYDKGFIITGDSYNSGGGDFDNVGVVHNYFSWVVKLDSSRNIVWQNKIISSTYPTLGDMTNIKQVIQTKDSGVVVIGSSTDSPTEFPGCFAFKYDKNGQLLWRYEQPFNNRIHEFYEIFEKPDGGLMICGTRNATPTGGQESGWLVHLNENGTFNREYIHRVGNGGLIFTHIDTAFGGGYIIGGQHYSNGANVFLGKVSVSGDLLWYKSYGGSGIDIVGDILPLTDNTYMVAATTTSSDGDVSGNHCIVGGICPEDVWLLKIDQSGNVLNKTIYGDYGADRVSRLIRYNGGVFMIGSSNSYLNSFSGNKGGFDVWTTQLDNNLNRLTAYGFYGGGKEDYGIDAMIDSTQQIYPVIFATTEGGGEVEGFHDATTYSNDEDTWIFKLGRFDFIKGYAFLDYNRNGIKETSEPFYKRGVFTTVNAREGESLGSYNQDGTFLFKVFKNLYEHITRLNINDTVYSILPPSHTTWFNFGNTFNVDSVAFALQLRPGLSDICMAAYTRSTIRMNEEAVYEAMLTNRSADIINNKQLFLLKDSRLSFISASPAPLRINGDSIIWQYTNLRSTDTLRYTVYLRSGIPPQVQMNDTLKSYFKAPLSTDADSTNNYAEIVQTVRTGFDPNDKTEMHNDRLEFTKAGNGEFLTYVIRFQNTGNDYAQNIIVRDTLDTQLNTGTLEILKVSHPFVFSINARQLQWTFPNIYLPDSTTNEPRSHGYIVFRIKTNKNIVPNSYVKNRVSIYFDYNLPVLTNTASTYLWSSVTTVPGTSSEQTKALKLYPNPVRDNIWVSYSGSIPTTAMIEIYAVTGKLMSVIPGKSLQPFIPALVELGFLPTGIYYCRFTGQGINEVHTILINR